MVDISVTIPGFQLVSEANRRGNWRKHKGRTQEQRGLTLMILRNDFAPPRLGVTEKLVVVMTRIAPRALDSDNAVGSCKAVRDGIADWLGINDNDPRIDWQVRQERGAVRQYAVRIEISSSDHL